jgi:flagellar biosynthesis protein
MSGRYFDTRRALERRAVTRYDDLIGSETPPIVTAGKGPIAERIVALAREHDIPLHQDAALVEALMRLEIGAMIPRELYTVVAEVLAFVYLVDAEAAGS